VARGGALTQNRRGFVSILASLPPTRVMDTLAHATAPGFVFTRNTSHDADEAAQRLRAWDQIYQQLTAGRFNGLTTDIWFGDLQVFRERSNQRMYEAGRCWPGSVTFGLPLGMRGEARFCGQALDLDSVLVLGPNGVLDFQTSRELDILGISMPQRLLSAVDDRIAEAPLSAAWMGSGLIRLDPATAAQMRAMALALFEAIEAAPDSLGSAAVRDQVRDRVLEELVHKMVSAALRPLGADRHARHREIVDAVRDFALQDHLEAALTVEQLCGLVGVSRRTLQYAFESVLGLSPVQYLRAARLQGVRRELRTTPRSAASIQDIAARWGFWHLGHFSNNYRELFGCRPSETPRPGN
jgi:AraC family ethanolamine operon transcriptional activator